MAAKPASHERPNPIQLDGLLDRAARCLVRQLRVLSRTGRHPADVRSAEAVFKTMLTTQEVMAQTRELVAKSKGWPESRPSSSDENRFAKRVGPPELDNDGRPKSYWDSDHEATSLLGAKKLGTRD